MRTSLSRTALAVLVAALVAFTTVLDAAVLWFVVSAVSWGVPLRFIPSSFAALTVLGMVMTAATIYSTKAFRRGRG